MSIYLAIKALIIIVFVGGIHECYQWHGTTLSSGLVDDFITGCARGIAAIIFVGFLLASVSFIVLVES